MNKIYWDRDKISIITDQIEAVQHKHCAMQLFLSVEQELEISVGEQQISCKCIVVNRNIPHSFSTGNSIHFSMIIEPTASIAEQLDEIMCGKGYHAFDNQNILQLQKSLFHFIHSDGIDEYQNFIIQLYKFLGLKEHLKIYDDRIKELLHEIEQCNCDTHLVASFADKVALSPSRLSHLFREQVGIPLKSYIQFHQMQKAFLTLLNGKNITEAAMLAGFDTPSHFAAVTKRMMGMPASISLKDSVFLKVYSVSLVYN